MVDGDRGSMGAGERPWTGKEKVGDKQERFAFKDI